MDYNSRPWEYEVVTYHKNGDRKSSITTDGVAAKQKYDDYNDPVHKAMLDITSVVLCQSRKGHALGQYEV
jgi:hypothetical protein